MQTNLTAVRQFLTGLILVFTTLAFANQEKQVPVDVHFHYFPESDGYLGVSSPCDDPLPEAVLKYYLEVEEKYGFKPNVENSCLRDPSYKDFLRKNDVEIAFLISPSFEINHDPKAKKLASNFWKFDLNYAPLMDLRVSQITQEHPSRFIGLCSISYSWPHDFAISTLQKCLSLPGMRGIKIHTSDRPMISTEAVNILRDAFTIAKNKQPFVLWHLDNLEQIQMRKYSGEKAQKISEFNERVIQQLLDFVESFPSITFIIAHSLHSVDALEQLNKLEVSRGSKYTNLYTELSTVERTHSDEEILTLRSELRKFGVDRILFGSDNAYSDKEDGHNLDSVLKFTQEEQQQILFTNGSRFLQKFID